MRELPLISIVIPTYNSELYIEETLQSVLSQSYQNWECIIVNDCSTDNSSSIINKYCNLDKRIKVINHKQNKGLSKARNSGIDAANGKYIAFLDSDDVWMPHHLETSANIVLEEEADLVFSYAYALKNNLYTTIPISSIAQKKFQQGIMKGKSAIESFLIHNNATPSFTLCKKEILIKHNSFSYYKKAEDLHTWIKLLVNDCSFYNTNQATGYYRIVENSMSDTDRSCTREVTEIVSLFRKDLEKLGINHSYYFKLWARRYFLLHNNKEHYIEAMNYISSFDESIFPIFLKRIAYIIPKKILKLLILKYLK